MSTLKAPPLLLGAALLFWGWQSGFLMVSVLMALVLEGARWVPLRWELSEKDFRRIWDFCSLLFVMASLYAFTSNEGSAAVAGLFQKAHPATQRQAMEQATVAALELFRWMPMVFFALTVAQAYSHCERIPWRVLSWLLRRREPETGTHGGGLNMEYPYFGCCVLAASITIRPTIGFYLGMCGLLGWALGARRPRRYGLAVWASLAVGAMVLAFFVQIGFAAATRWANSQSARWLSQYMVSGTDARESRTAIGDVGRIKLSGKIVMRMRTPHSHPPPALLREASYRFFKFPNWVGSGNNFDFGYIQYETNHTTWELATARVAHGPVQIAQYLSGAGEGARRGLLALPHGILRLENLSAFLMSTNSLGVVRVDEGPGLVIYDAYYSPASTIDAPSDNRDLSLPSQEVAALWQVAAELELEGLTATQIVDKLAAWFSANFEYSTWLPERNRERDGLTALGNFLLREHTGHCEFFATAAVLLLRQAGVPARYAVGYAVHERKGNQYIVRARDAHAWCLAWIDGAWRDVDFTPPSWQTIEAGHASWAEWFSDAWSRIGFEFAKWRWGRTDWRQIILQIMLPVLGLLLVRMFWRKQWKRFRQRKPPGTSAAFRPGASSEFYLVEQELARRGIGRQPAETGLGWLRRVQGDARVARICEPLRAMLRLHYRYRFDPLGLDPYDRAKLRADAQRCLARLKHSA